VDVDVEPAGGGLMGGVGTATRGKTAR